MATNLPMVREDAVLMPQTFEQMMAQADVLVRSGLLPTEVKTAAAAVAIMMTGRELSIPPMQSFRSIYVVKGKPTLSAQLMGALIFRAGHSYRVVESTNERCAIEFTRKGHAQPYRHEFTIDDAKRAGLGGQTWQAYPKAMLFSRCMSAGARVAMPDVIAGMYTPEELAEPDAVVVDDTGEVIEIKAARVYQEPPAFAPVEKSEPKPEPKPEPCTKWTRPMAPETVKEAIGIKSAKNASPASAAQRGLCAGMLEGLFPFVDKDVARKMRYSLMTYLVGTDSTQNLTSGQASALIDWASTGEGSERTAHPDAVREAAAIIAMLEREAGQQELL
jgi:hypothetical protein